MKTKKKELTPAHLQTLRAQHEEIEALRESADYLFTNQEEHMNKEQAQKLCEFITMLEGMEGDKWHEIGRAEKELIKQQNRNYYAKGKELLTACRNAGRL